MKQYQHPAPGVQCIVMQHDAGVDDIGLSLVDRKPLKQHRCIARTQKQVPADHAIFNMLHACAVANLYCLPCTCSHGLHGTHA